MKLSINWKVGIISAITVAFLGIGFFVLVGSNVDSACKMATSQTTGCRAYGAINTVIQGYSDLWRSIFAKRCVGGNGPDDCLGPDAMIMLVTLLVIGFIAGNLVWRKKKQANHDSPLNK